MLAAGFQAIQGANDVVHAVAARVGNRSRDAAIGRKVNHDVRTANNAADALRLVATFQPDAIIVDLRMPLVNGLGFLYRLRLHMSGIGVPVAVITGDCSVAEESLREIRELGAELYYKPMWGDDVVVLAAGLLAHHPAAA